VAKRLSIICKALGHGVTRSKRLAMQCGRKAAENGNVDACLRLASCIYGDYPYARDIGRVGDAAGDVMPAGIMEGHDLPRDVLTSVAYWVRKGCRQGLTLVYFQAQRKRFPSDRGCIWGCLGGVQGVHVVLGGI